MCQGIETGRLLNVIEIDAASNNGVEDIRRITEEVKYPPTEGKFRVYIIDEVHMLSTGAFNAVLKTLEEPPEYVIFILATTEIAKVPQTILSRCMPFEFRRITNAEIESELYRVLKDEGVQAEPEAISHIARSADGSMRDALSLLDRCILEPLTMENVLKLLGALDTAVFSAFFKAIMQKDVSKLMEIIEDAFISGKDMSAFVSSFISYLRNLMVAKAAPDVPLDLSSEGRQMVNEDIKSATMENITTLIKGFSELLGKLKTSSQKRITLETYAISLVGKSETRYDILRKAGNAQYILGQLSPISEPPKFKRLMEFENFEKYFEKYFVLSQAPNIAHTVFTGCTLETMYVGINDTVLDALFKTKVSELLKIGIPSIAKSADPIVCIAQLGAVLKTEYDKYLSAEQNVYSFSGRIYSLGHELINDAWVIPT